MSAASRSWIGACIAAEALGMTAAASAARAADALRDAGSGPMVALVVVVVGGLVEGGALGVLQGRVLRPRLGRSVARRWATVTLLVAGIGWAAASAPSAFAGPDASGVPPAWLVLGSAAGLGAVMGLLLGAAQSGALRGSVADPWRWTGRSVLGWTPTMVVIFVGATIPSAAWQTPAVVLLGTATGVVAGAVLGLLTAGHWSGS